MAEGKSIITDTIKDLEVVEKNDNLECAVCLQTCIHPAKLPCGHIFCFLCIKGIANQSKKCAMCRQEIPRNFIEHPILLNNVTDTSQNYDGTYQWFYEGRNGWWKYDDRTNEDIETAFQMNINNFEILICGELYIIDFYSNVQYAKYRPGRKRLIKRDLSKNVSCKGWWQYDERTSKELEAVYESGEKICELLIAGFLYVADLATMLQIRRNDPSRRRRIKRDLAGISKKGVAGLRIDSDAQGNIELESQYLEITRPHSPIEGDTDSLTPITPSNTPQSPTSGRESPQEDELEATIERIQTLHMTTENRVHNRTFLQPHRNNEH